MGSFSRAPVFRTMLWWLNGSDVRGLAHSKDDKSTCGILKRRDDNNNVISTVNKRFGH